MPGPRWSALYAVIRPLIVLAVPGTNYLLVEVSEVGPVRLTTSARSFFLLRSVEFSPLR